MKNTFRVTLLLLFTFASVALLAPFAFAAPRAQDNSPIVIIDRPPSNKEYDEGDTVEIESTSSAAVGIVQVDLYVDGKLIHSDLTPNGQPQVQFKILQSWKALGAGKHTVVVRATDSENQKGEAAIFVIVRGATPSPTPTTTPIFTTPTPGPEACTLSSRFAGDITIPDNTLVAPGALFTKIWAIQNNGTCAWGPGFTAVFIGGEQMAGASPSPIPSAAPGQTINVSMNFIAPGAPGAHRSTWQLQAANGARFGISFYVLVQVPGPPTPTPPPPPQGCQGAPQITFFNSNKGSINRGESAKLQWGQVLNADYAALETPQGNSGIATPGEQRVTPNQTTTYTLAAYCKGFRVQAQTTIFVNGPPPPTPVPPQSNRIESVDAVQTGGAIKITVGYYWNGQLAPANMEGYGLRNGSPNTNTDRRAIIAGFKKFVTLTVQGGNKINSVNVCMIGHGGQELVCSSGSVR